MAQILPLPIERRKKPISVIMVTYMTGPALLESINAVIADPDIFELILVDNGNTADARQRLSQLVMKHDHVRLLQGHGNIGFARACNYGARLARVTEGAARHMADCGKVLNIPWVTGGMLKDVNGREQRGGRRGHLTPLSALVSFTPLHKFPMFNSIHKETLQAEKFTLFPKLRSCIMARLVKCDAKKLNGKSLKALRGISGTIIKNGGRKLYLY